MAYQYSDWITQTSVATKKSRLELHIAEVGAECGPNLSINGRSRGNDPAVSYYQSLLAEYAKLIADSPSQIPAESPRVRSSFTLGRPV